MPPLPHTPGSLKVQNIPGLMGLLGPEFSPLVLIIFHSSPLQFTRFGRDPSKLNPKTPKAWDLASWQSTSEELEVNCSFVDFVFSGTGVQ